MPSALQSKSTVKYAGVTFPTSSRVRVSAEPVYDSSGRTEKYIKYSVSVDCVFAADEFPQTISDWKGSTRGVITLVESTGRIDEGFEHIRRFLLEPGRQLVLTWAGVGDQFTINANDTVDFGPKPSISLIEPIGSTRAIHVVWNCEATCPDFVEQSSIGDRSQPFGEWNYEVDYSFSPEGLTVRTLTGVLESFVGRFPDQESGLGITQSAERFLDNLDIPLDDRFRRSQSYHLSKDKRFLHYTVTDSEIPSDNPLYPNCVQMDVRQRISSNLVVYGGDFISPSMWRLSLSGTITVAPGIKRSIAWMAFKNIIQSRTAKVSDGTFTGIDSEGRPTDEQPAYLMIPVGFSIEEDIFGRSISFNISCGMFCDLKTILLASGMWEPVPGTWGAWKSSSAVSKAHSSRGSLDASNPKGIDVIVNFNEGVPSQGTDETLSSKQPDEYDTTPLFPCPSEDATYLDYFSETEIVNSGGVVSPVKLGAEAATNKIEVGPLGKGKVQVEDLNSPSDNANEAIIQMRSIGHWTMRFFGYIIRVGEPFTVNDVPTVRSVGGEDAIRIGGGFTLPRKAQGQLGDCPVFVLRWSHTYQIKTPDLLDIVVDNEPRLDALSPPPQI